MNSLTARLSMALLLVMVQQCHAAMTGSLPNTVDGMLVFHWSAALFDAALLSCAPLLLLGRLCDDLEALCLLSMVGNALGWALYLAYAPPVIYNMLMTGLSYVQWIRLFYVDRDDANRPMGPDLVRRPALLGA